MLCRLRMPDEQHKRGDKGRDEKRQTGAHDGSILQERWLRDESGVSCNTVLLPCGSG